MTAFYDNGYVCILERDDTEIDEHFRLRGKFVTMQKPKTDDEYNKCVLYSMIFINVYLKKCKYNDDIMKVLNSYNILPNFVKNARK